METRFKFTKRKLESLTPSDKTVTYHDTKMPGLKMSVSTKGTKTFFVYRKINGRPERIKIGNFPQTTVELATDQAAIINSEITKGSNRNETKRALRKEPTLKDLLDQYVDYHKRDGKKSLKDEQARYELYLKDWNKRKLSEISRENIQALHDKISKEHPVQANRVLSLIHGMYNKAIYKFRMFSGDNPATGIEKNDEKSRDRFLVANELGRFFEAVAQEKNPVIRDYILMSLLTGARRSNVLAMRWDEIDFKQAKWTIPDTKNGESLVVPLVEDAIQILRNIQRAQISDPKPTKKAKRSHKRKTSEFVFPGRGITGHLVEPKKGWKRVKDFAGIKNLRLHDLRRSLGSWQAMGGSSLPIIGKTLGHKSVSTTAIYARLQVDPVRESMERAVTDMQNADKPKAEVTQLKVNE